MEISITPPEKQPTIDRGYVVTLVIDSFKGRRNVEVHLFRHGYDPAEESGYDWDDIIEDTHHPDVDYDPGAVRRFLLETFTEAERDQVIEFLKEKYANRVSLVESCAISMPIPIGVAPLSEIPEGKTMGFIRFDSLPNYTLPFAFRGFYDLAQHEPLVQE